MPNFEQRRREGKVWRIAVVDGSVPPDPVDLRDFPVLLEAYQASAPNGPVSIEASIGHGLALDPQDPSVILWTVSADQTLDLSPDNRPVLLEWEVSVYTDMPHTVLDGLLAIMPSGLDRATP